MGNHSSTIGTFWIPFFEQSFRAPGKNILKNYQYEKKISRENSLVIIFGVLTFYKPKNVHMVGKRKYYLEDYNK